MAHSYWLASAFSMVKAAEAMHFSDSYHADAMRRQRRRAWKRRVRRRFLSVASTSSFQAEDWTASRSDTHLECRDHASFAAKQPPAQRRFLRGQRRPDQVDVSQHPLLELREKLCYPLHPKGDQVDRIA